MARVLIISDNRLTSVYLKRELIHRHHDVRQSRNIGEVIASPKSKITDVVLIDQSIDNSNGWTLFNFLKQVVPGLAVLLYSLENNSSYTIDWICQAVEAAYIETNSYPLNVDTCPAPFYTVQPWPE